MTTPISPGPLSQAELLSLWTSAVDQLYAQPLIEAGEGYGLEVHEQAQAMFARVSAAIDFTTQALYIRNWSGQTSPPAAGQSFASVSLTLTRTNKTNALTLTAGQFAVLESTNDYGPSGSVPTLTGRRYVLSTTVTFAASVATATAVFISDTPGTGFNNPLPGTITSIEQIGAGYFNQNASVVVSPVPMLVTYNEADVVVPANVGQYVTFTAGANEGVIAQIVAYTPPQPYGLHPNGGSVQLANVVGTLVAESGTASWEILSWATDFGITVAQAASPTGGGLAMLDALGYERKVKRAPGEPDALYCQRMSQLTDTISPNAVIRAVNRVLAPYNTSCSLLEVGTLAFQGFYFDCDPTAARSACFAWDLDLTVAADAWKVWLSFLEMRAFFLIEVPAIGTIAETGWSYDQVPASTYIGGAWDYFGSFGSYCLDGVATNSVNVNLQIVNALESTRAAGVSYDLVPAGETSNQPGTMAA